MDEKVWGPSKQEDFVAAQSFLGLLFPDTSATEIANQFIDIEVTIKNATDILRAAGYPVPKEHEVENWLNEDETLSPVLLARTLERRLLIVDGYERLCESFELTKDREVPVRLI